MKSMKCHGFTLIEIMVALVILAIAMSAVMYHLQQNIKTLSHLQNKTIAHWVAMNVTHHIEAGLIDFPATEQTMQSTTEMLHQYWHWEATRSTSSNPRIEKIVVTVQEQPDASPLATLIAYRLQKRNMHA